MADTISSYLCRTSAFTVAPLAARKVERLVQRFHFSEISCLEAETTVESQVSSLNYTQSNLQMLWKSVKAGLQPF